MPRPGNDERTVRGAGPYRDRGKRWWRRWRRRRRRRWWRWWWWWWRADRSGDAEHLIWAAGSPEHSRAPAPGWAGAEPTARVLPGRAEVRHDCSICPEPLARGGEVLFRLNGKPVGPREEADRRVDRDDEARTARKGLVQAFVEQRPREVAGAVRIDAHVNRGCRSRPAVVDALNLDAGHVPAGPARNGEVVGRLAVEGVRRGLVILRVGRERARVVVLVVEHIARGRTRRCAEHEGG